MKRIKAIFNAIRTLGRNPHDDILATWERCKLNHGATAGDFHLIEQIVFGAADESELWLKKLGEQAGKDAEK